MTLIRVSHLICLLLVAIAMALTLAHALELPGKMLLDRDTYLAIQKIYYPGFTIGGAERCRAATHSSGNSTAMEDA